MQLCKIATKTLIPNEACRFQEICLRDLSLCRSNSWKDGVCVHSPIIKLGLQYDMYLSNNLLNLSCSAFREFEYGVQIHASMVKLGLELNPYVNTTLIDLYTSCDYSVEAYKLLSSMEDGDAVSWTTMISSLPESEKWSEAIRLYIQMIEASVYPNEFTFVKFLGASYFIGFNYGKLLHEYTFIFGNEMNVILKKALNMYSKFRQMEEAIKVAKLTREHDVFLWSTIISGFAKSLRVREAVNAFLDMETCGILPNNFTFASLLNACSSVLSLHLGEQFHSGVVMAGLEGDVYVGNPLVDMYSKCSSIKTNAMKAFREISSMSSLTSLIAGFAEQDVVSWNAMISGLVSNGHIFYALSAFDDMKLAGVEPDSVTFSSLLFAFSHGGLFDLSLEYFHAMEKTYNITPNLDNYVCLVDLLGRAGRLEEAIGVIETMPFRANSIITKLY
ncbi:hypothetical protein K1719_016037 [Acacia pycnantha]|nr:hypothetical protein K1719_016037 [Acacia pycnantha]